MQDKPVRMGVIGVGSLGQWHARIYSELEHTVLSGVYDVDPDRAREIAERYNTEAVPSIEELCERIDAASVAVPTDRHLEVFNLLAERGIHMLVEKPIATTTREARQMVRAAEQRNLILQVGHVERFNPVVQFVDEQLTSARFIEATRLAPYPPAREDAPPRGTEVSVVLDLMIHDLDIILQLARSPVVDIRATGVAVLSPTEDIANARIKFKNGCIANVTASRISREKLRKLRVFQDDSYMSLDYMEQSGQFYRKSATGIEALPVPIEKGEPLLAELDSFTRCVRDKRDPLVTGRHGSQALKLAVDICTVISDDPS